MQVGDYVELIAPDTGKLELAKVVMHNRRLAAVILQGRAWWSPLYGFRMDTLTDVNGNPVVYYEGSLPFEVALCEIGGVNCAPEIKQCNAIPFRDAWGTWDGKTSSCK